MHSEMKMVCYIVSQHQEPWRNARTGARAVVTSP